MNQQTVIEYNTPETLQAIFQMMVRIAEADAAIQRGLSSGELQFQYYPCGGQEAIAAALSTILSKDDYMVTTYRGIHDIVAKGTPMCEIMAESSTVVSAAHPRAKVAPCTYRIQPQASW